MKTILLFLTVCWVTPSFSQAPKTDFYKLIKSILSDSTGYENVGDWGVGNPKKFPVGWTADRIEMSEDTSINFFRVGSANIAVDGASAPDKWTLMLKGPRMGYTSFSMLSPASTHFHERPTLDSLFGNKPFHAKLLKKCDANATTGFYYYEVKIPGKDVEFIKLSWLSANGKTALRVDGYDNWSKYAAKLDCR